MVRTSSRLSTLLATLVALAIFGVPASVKAADDPVALQFAVQPGGGRAGEPWAQQPVVRIVDAAGNTVTSSHLAVLLTRVGSGPILVCQENPVRAIEGVATFHGCQTDQATSGIRVRANAFELEPAVSEPFTLTERVFFPAVQLEPVVPQSGNVAPLFTATAGGPIWFDVQFRFVDQTSTTISTGDVSTAPVTLSMAPNGSGATVSCPGGLTVAAVAGVASFNDCSISAPGDDLHLIATSPGLGEAWSFPIDAWPAGSPRGPALDSEATPTVVTFGEQVEYVLKMRPAVAGQHVGDRAVHVQSSRDPYDPETFSTMTDLTTDPSGAASFSFTPRSNLYYRAVFGGDTALGPAESTSVNRVIVRQRLATSPSTRRRTVSRGTAVTFKAVVRPIRTDIPRPLLTWRIWHFVNGTYSFSTRTATVDENGNAFLPVTFSAGRWTIEAGTAPTSMNANSTTARWWYVVP